MKTLIEIKVPEYGVFIIEEYAKNKVCIWWDIYEDNDGMLLEPNLEIYESTATFAIQDFSDMPKDGVFKSIEEAKNYIKEKFIEE